MVVDVNSLVSHEYVGLDSRVLGYSRSGLPRVFEKEVLKSAESRVSDSYLRVELLEQEKCP